MAVRANCHLDFAVVARGAPLTNQLLALAATFGARPGPSDRGKTAHFRPNRYGENDDVFVFCQYCEKTYLSTRVAAGDSSDVLSIDEHALADRRQGKFEAAQAATVSI